MPEKFIGEPLFVEFVNGKIDAYVVAKRFVESTRDEDSKVKVKEKLERKDVLDIGIFQADFKRMMHEFTEMGFIPQVRSFLTSYMSSSLVEYKSEVRVRSGGMEDRWIGIKGVDGPWVEGVVCYNFVSFVKLHGPECVKKCKSCSKIFVNKGKYASYCSETCKAGKS